MALMTIEDLERESKVSRFTWRSWIRTGRIAAVRLGRRVLVDEVEYQHGPRASQDLPDPSGRRWPQRQVPSAPRLQGAAVPITLRVRFS